MVPPSSLALATPRGGRPPAARQSRFRGGKLGLAAGLLVLANLAQAADAATPSALADLGLSLLRQPGPPNAVVSPVAVASALGMVHAGLNGPAEDEIEALFAPREALPFKQRLPALLKQLRGGETASPFVMAGRVWMDVGVAAAVPPAYLRRMATRYGADATRVSFAKSEATRAEINAWTAQKTAGRVAELLPPGSVTADTRITLTTALHFKSPWERPFDAAKTEARPFQMANGAAPKPVPTLLDERGVQQARVDGTLVMSLPFAGEAWTLLLAVPAEGRSVDALVAGLDGRQFAGWQAALKPEKCAFALPKFTLAPRAGSLRPALESMGVKKVFTTAADLRPMLGRRAKDAHLGDVFHAAGISIDETGGEAVAAAAATVQSKSLAMPVPACAVDRPFLFAVVHRATGTPLFIGRIGDPTQE